MKVPCSLINSIRCKTLCCVCNSKHLRSLLNVCFTSAKDSVEGCSQLKEFLTKCFKTMLQVPRLSWQIAFSRWMTFFFIFFWLRYSPVDTVILWLEVIFLKSMSMCSNEATKMTVLRWVRGRGWYRDSNDPSLSRSIYYNSNAVCTGVRVYRVNQEKGGQEGWLFLHRLHSRSSEFTPWEL